MPEGPIVVFGASGFIGANLFRRLRATRQDVFAVTHQRYAPWRLRGIPPENILHCDITDEESVQAIFRRHAFRTIFHFSAFGAYSRQTDPKRIYETNLLGLMNVVSAARVRGFDALVHAGSSSEYGTHSAGPRENDSKHPNSHYAVSKVSASYLIQYLGEVEGLPAVNLRYYSVYGPWEEPDRLVPRLVESAVNGKLPRLVDPDVSRDFVYVDDAVDAAILAAGERARELAGRSINIGSGTKTTIRDMVETTRRVFGVDEVPTWGSMPNRAWDLKEWFGDPRLASDVLGWKARTSLEDGLRLTANWMKAEGAAAPLVEASVDVEKPVRLSAIIACYRDAQAIPVMHQRLTKVFREMRVDYEIIFVNDASPDDTDAVLAELAANDDHVVAIEHSRNFGSQSAFLSGMDLATGHAVILMDGDLQDPPELIPEFYAKWREGNDVVYGRRVRRETSPFLAVCYKAFYRLFRGMAYVPIPVDAGDFSLMDRKVVDELRDLPETDQFLRGLRAWVGFKQTGVDYVRPERAFGRSTNNWRKNFWWARKAIFSFSFVPLELMLFLGIGLTGLAVVGLAVQLTYRLLHPDMPHGVATIVSLVLLFGGANLLAISVVGEYVGKILDETKRRPKFIRCGIRAAGKHLTTTEKIDKFIALRATETPA